MFKTIYENLHACIKQFIGFLKDGISFFVINDVYKPKILKLYLKNVISTFPAKIVLTRKNHNRFREHFQTNGTNKLLLQAVHPDLTSNGSTEVENETVLD